MTELVARYRVHGPIVTGDGRLVGHGEIIEHDGVPNTNMEPINSLAWCALQGAAARMPKHAASAFIDNARELAARSATAAEAQRRHADAAAAELALAERAAAAPAAPASVWTVPVVPEDIDPGEIPRYRLHAPTTSAAGDLLPAGIIIEFLGRPNHRMEPLNPAAWSMSAGAGHLADARRLAENSTRVSCG
jgi:hypothetical protein